MAGAVLALLVLAVTAPAGTWRGLEVWPGHRCEPGIRLAGSCTTAMGWCASESTGATAMVAAVVLHVVGLDARAETLAQCEARRGQAEQRCKRGVSCSRKNC